MQTADFNGDGHPDVAALNTDGPASVLAVLLGNGDGTLGSAIHVSASGPTNFATGDLNGDGLDDLVVAVGEVGAKAEVLLSDGTGGFTKAGSFKVQDGIYALAVADIDGDGAPDVVAASTQSMYSALGNGDGTLQTATSRTVAGLDSTTVLAVGDFDGNGRADLAVAGPGQIQAAHPDLPRREETATSTTSSRSITGRGEPTLATGDVDGDGQRRPRPRDADERGGLLGARVPASSPLRRSSTRGQVQGAAVGDLDGDGLPDVAVTNLNEATVTFLINAGSRTFASPVTTSTGKSPEGLAVAGLRRRRPGGPGRRELQRRRGRVAERGVPVAGLGRRLSRTIFENRQGRFPDRPSAVDIPYEVQKDPPALLPLAPCARERRGLAHLRASEDHPRAAWTTSSP